MTVKDLKVGIARWSLTKERIVDLSIGVTAILIYELLARPIYRPYIYNNKIYDFHVADTIGNSLGAVAAVFILIGFIGHGRAKGLFLVKTITISVVLFEIAHPLLGKPIDPWDILATVITGGLCLVFYNVVHPASLDKGSLSRK